MREVGVRLVQPFHGAADVASLPGVRESHLARLRGRPGKTVRSCKRPMDFGPRFAKSCPQSGWPSLRRRELRVWPQGGHPRMSGCSSLCLPDRRLEQGPLWSRPASPSSIASLPPRCSRPFRRRGILTERGGEQPELVAHGNSWQTTGWPASLDDRDVREVAADIEPDEAHGAAPP